MTEKQFHIKRLFVFEHEVNGPTELVGENSQGLTIVMFVTQPLHIFFGLFGFAQADHGRCLDGPFEMGVADLFYLTFPLICRWIAFRDGSAWNKSRIAVRMQIV